MELDVILRVIEQNGYIGLFLWLWIGVFGMPVPNEIIAMTVGLAASQGTLQPVAAFFVTYAGIVCALTTSYMVGKYIGGPLLPRFQKRKSMKRAIDRSFRLIDKHHAVALLFSYFLPGIRNFVPFLYGLSQFSYRSFAIFAYLGAFIWLSLTFSLGYWFGDHQETIYRYETEFLSAFVAVLLFYVLFRILRKRRLNKLGRSEG